MKTTFIMLAAALIAVVLATFLCAVAKVNGKRTLRNVSALFTFYCDGALDTLKQIFAAPGQAYRLMANGELGAGVHDAVINKQPVAAITTRHLLYVRNTDDDHVAVAGASDALAPLGTIADELTAAQITAGEDIRAVNLLGKGPTKRMVASEAITVGDEVWTAASGKVQDRTATAGTYWILGVAVTAAAADGDVIEVNDHAPVRVTV